MATDSNNSTKWMVRGIAAGVLLIGWFFVAWQNRFHFTAPLVMVELAYTAVIAIIFNMYRTGASVVAANDEDDGDASWGQPMGARSELDREKKALLKAIKEAEFDQMMGKLSSQDADQMIKTFRARAIEVIKEIDRLDGVGDGTIRDQIEREVKARLEVEAAVEKKVAIAEKQAALDKSQRAGARGNLEEIAKANDRKKSRGKRNKAEAAKADDKADDKVEAKIDDKVDEDNKLEADADEAVMSRDSSTEAVTKEVRS